VALVTARHQAFPHTSAHCDPTRLNGQRMPPTGEMGEPRLRLIRGEGTRLEKWSHAKVLPKVPGSTFHILAGGGHKPYLLEWDLYVNDEQLMVMPPTEGK